jgi:hypothetical protein
MLARSAKDRRMNDEPDQPKKKTFKRMNWHLTSKDDEMVQWELIEKKIEMLADSITLRY